MPPCNTVLNVKAGAPFAVGDVVLKRGRYENTSETRRKNDFSDSSSDG